MSDFDELWHFITHRRSRNVPQIKEELQFIFYLIQGCRSYLEVGTAEGDSLYVLSHALAGSNPLVTYVDIAEKHTEYYREEVLRILKDEKFIIHAIHGDSHDHENIKEATVYAPYDVVLIDAGHTERDVIADSIAYGHLASKFILFHDIGMKPVKESVQWYAEKQGLNIEYFHLDPNSQYGFAIIRK